MLNHFDYVDKDVRKGVFNVSALEFLRKIERSIGRKIDWLGTGPAQFTQRQNIGDAGGSIDTKKSIPT